MVFGTASSKRFLCIDIQVNKILFVVVRDVGGGFAIDYHYTLVLENEVSSEGGKDIARYVDTLSEIKKTWKDMPVLVSLADTFCQSELLVGAAFASLAKVEKKARENMERQAYVWADVYKKKNIEYASVCAVEKSICDLVYGVTQKMYTEVYMYPRNLVLAHLPPLQSSFVCDIAETKTIVSCIQSSHTLLFSVLPYGMKSLRVQLQNKFQVTDGEVEEILSAYGTSLLPRKDGHMVHKMVHAYIMPIVEEIQSLKIRMREVQLEVPTRLSMTGAGALYVGIAEDLERLTQLTVREINVWEGCIDLDTYLPSIHKNESSAYMAIAGLMHILRHGLRYTPIDL